jgi:hypothetical protein
MLHPLEKKVKSVTRLARGQLLLFAASCVAAVAAFAAFAAGLADYLLRFDDVGLRLILSAAVLAVVAIAGYLLLWPALRFRRGDVQVARRIERRYPQLDGRLSSSLAFLQQSADDPTAGSPTLRKAVVAEASALTDQLDLSGAVDLTWGRRALVAAVNLCRVLILVALLDPASSGLAAARLAMPWNQRLAWPRRFDLAFVDPPRRIAAGSDFEVTLTARNGRLPKEVVFQYWYDDDGSDRLHSERLAPSGGQATVRLSNVRRPFNYRAVGGDHQNMPWLALAVVEPPRVEGLQVQLVPPAYTGQSETPSPPAIRAVEGTRVALSGRATRPIQAAWLRLDGENGPRAKAAIADDGLGFTFAADAPGAWTLDRSGHYWIELVDREGLHAGTDARWEATAIVDQPPNVSLEQPGPTTNVTRQALVPLKVIVDDDLAVHTVELRFRRSDKSEQGDQVITLYQGPPSVRSPPPAEATKADGPSALADEQTSDQHLIEQTWDLAQLENLEPGVTLEFYVAAVDYKPQTGQSTLRKLAIISPDELESQLARRRTAIINRLSEALQLERDTRSQTKSLEIQLAEADGFNSRDIDQLQGAELVQRQVRERLVGDTDSVRGEIQGLLDDLQRNRIDSPDVDRRMQELQAAVTALGERKLPLIEHQLVAVLKISRTALFEAERSCGDAPPAASAATAAQRAEALAALADAGRGQDEAIVELESLLGELSQWDNYRRFSREIGRVRDEQNDLAEQTDQLRIAALGKSEGELTLQQRADLRKLAERQLELARRLDGTLGRMQQMRDELAERDPLAAQTLGDAVDAARRLALSGQMHESGRTIEDNRPGEAVAMQRDVARGLQEVLDVLANRREHELSRLVEQLQKSDEQLEELRRREQEIREQLSKTAAQTDPARRADELQRLVKQQQDLADEIRRLSRRLERLQADEPAQSLAQGASQAEGAAAAAGESDAPRAAEASQDAVQTLEKAAEELARAIAQAEQDLVQEQLVRLEQEIQGLIARQQRTIADTQDLDQEAKESGELDRRRLDSRVVDLARHQRQLAADTAAIGTRLASAEAFQLSLRGAAREMLRAAAGLDRLETGQATQNMQIVALARLMQTAAALAPESPEAGGPEGGQGGAGTQPGGLPMGDATALAELKLLRLMQQEINRRTTEIEDQRRSGALSPELEQELIELSAEQGRLADLMLNLSRPSVQNPEDNPAGLPVAPMPDKNGKQPEEPLIDSLLPGSPARDEERGDKP